MKFGQRYTGKGNISVLADYVVLNICGLKPVEIVQKYFLYEIDKPILIIGDYTSQTRNASEDDLIEAERIFEIKDTIKSLKAFGAEIIGITIYPVSREGLKKLGLEVTFQEFVDKLKDIYPIPVFVGNKSSSDELYLSKKEELIEFSQNNKMVLDCFSLFESCGYDRSKCLKVIDRLNIDNIEVLHIRYSNKENSKDCFSKEEIDVYNQGVLELLMCYKGKIPYATFIFSEDSGHPRFEKAVRSLHRMFADDRS